MKKLTGNCRSLLYSLWYKRDYFSKRNKLAMDGSFSYTDKRLAQELDVATKTIMRGKKFLKDNGYIKLFGGAKGRATKYWMLRRPDKKSSFKHLSEQDNLSQGNDKLSLTTPQNVSLNKETTNEINKGVNDLPYEEIKNGFLGLAQLNGKEWATGFYLRQGLYRETISKILGEPE